jgi:ribosome-associated heat shock protein Hsp15
MAEKEKIRIDKFLWSIRIFKTRSLAAEACATGKVRSNGVTVKPAKTVGVGDQYEIKTASKKLKIEVTSVIHNRVGHEEAIKHYIDLSPKEETDKTQVSAFVFNTGKRQSKQGRPTKKEKRRLDDFLQ